MTKRSQRQNWFLVLRMSKMGKPIKFSQHALDNMTDRMHREKKLKQRLERENAYLQKKGRLSFRKNFSYNGMWKGKFYNIKQVMPIVVEEPERFVVVTVHVFFIGGLK